MNSKVFLDGVEVSISEGSITSTDQAQVNKGTIKLERPVGGVAQGSTVEVRSPDSSVVFRGVVNDTVQKRLWTVKFYGVEQELVNTRIGTVYTDVSPLDVVQNIVDTSSNELTFTPTNPTTQVLEQFIAKGYKMEQILRVAELLGRKTLFSFDGTVRLVDTSFGPTLTLKYTEEDIPLEERIELESWREISKTVYNSVEVQGGFRSIKKDEDLLGTNTEFTLDKKPTGSFQAFDNSGTEIPPSQYRVQAEQQKIVFEISQTDPSVQYSYDRPVIIRVTRSGTDQNNQKDKVIQQPNLTTTSDLRSYAKNWLEQNSEARLSTKGTLPGLRYDIDVGENIRVIDSIRGITRTLTVQSVTHTLHKDQTSLVLGQLPPTGTDQQVEVQRRIKKLEEQNVNEDVVGLNRFILDTATITATPSISVRSRKVNDVFTLNHPTLNQLRNPEKTSTGIPEDYITDASNNGRGSDAKNSNNTWNTFNGWLGPACNLKNVDEVVNTENPSTTSDPGYKFTGNQALAFSVKTSAVDITLYEQTGTDTSEENRVLINNSGELVYRRTSNSAVILTVNLGVVNDNAWHRLVFNQDGTSLDSYLDGALISTDTTQNNNGVGQETRRFPGQSTDVFIDDFKIWSSALTTSSVTDDDKKYNVQSNDLYVWHSFDNPRLDDKDNTRKDSFITIQ